MKLYEYMAKEILAQHGVPTPGGRVAASPQEAESIARALGPVAIKAQVLVGGRGKAGGVKLAETPEEAREKAAQILGMDLKGYVVERVLVDPKIPIDQEIYLSITFDPIAKKPLIMASAAGGVEIEEVDDALIYRRLVDIERGFSPYIGREVAHAIGLSGTVAHEFTDILGKMYEVFRTTDAELVETNPLVVSGGHLIAADARLNIDDDALFRHPELPRVEEGSELEKEVHAIGLAYVQLDGDIAVMANGAGLNMGTLDVLQYYGGSPANFLDAGGGASVEPTRKAIEVLLRTHPKAIFINIFGGITRCDDVANAIRLVKEQSGIPVPLVVRLVGTNEEQGVRILQEAGISAYREMSEAAQQVVQVTRGEAR